MKRYIRSNVAEDNAFSKFIGDIETDVIDGYDVLGTKFVTDYGYQYEVIIRDLSDRANEIGYITVDYAKDDDGVLVRAWRGSDEDTTFAAGKSLDDIEYDVTVSIANMIDEYETGEIDE